MNLFNTLFNKKFFRRQRILMRGYKNLKNSGRLSLLDNIKNSITREGLRINMNSITILKNDVAIKDHNIIIHQFLIERLLTISFNKAVLTATASGKKIVYPLPFKWQKILLENDIRPNHFLCTILFWKFIFIHGVYGIGEFFWQIIRVFRKSIHRAYYELGNYVYFDALQNSNLPEVSGEYQLGIISTYVNKFPKPHKIDVICHNVQDKSNLIINGFKTIAIPSPLPPLNFNKSLKLFLLNGIGCILIALFDILKGKWQSLLMLREKMKSLTFRFNNPNKIAKQFLFHNSGWIYRPVWTYVAEEMGLSIVFYFYSANCERFKKDGKYPDSMTNAWALTTWPEYIVWDTYHSDFVKRIIQRENKATIVGPISFVFSNKKFEVGSKKFIAIFDVQPMRETFYNTLGIDTEYYVPEVANLFLNNIIEVATSSNYFVIIKRKREIGKHLHHSYKSNMERYANSYNCIFVDPSIPAEEIIQQSEFVISMPFTSTAIIAKEMEKPSFYYDPSGIIEKDDRAAHGIPIISTNSELEMMFQEFNSN